MTANRKAISVPDVHCRDRSLDINKPDITETVAAVTESELGLLG